MDGIPGDVGRSPSCNLLKFEVVTSPSSKSYCRAKAELPGRGESPSSKGARFFCVPFQGRIFVKNLDLGSFPNPTEDFGEVEED